MAPSKEERGSVARRTLFSQSQQIAGGWLNATVVLELRFVPVEGQQVHPLDKGDDSGSYRRQTGLQLSAEDRQKAEEAQAAQEEEGKWLEGLADAPGSCGYPTQTSSQSTQQQQTTAHTRRSRMTSSRSTQETPSSPSCQSSKTSQQTRSRQLQLYQTSSRPAIASDESLERSSSQQTNYSPTALPLESAQQDSSSCESTPPGSPSTRTSPPTEETSLTPMIHRGSGDEPGSSQTTSRPAQTPQGGLRPHNRDKVKGKTTASSAESPTARMSMRKRHVSSPKTNGSS